MNIHSSSLLCWHVVLCRPTQGTRLTPGRDRDCPGGSKMRDLPHLLTVSLLYGFHTVSSQNHNVNVLPDILTSHIRMVLWQVWIAGNVS